MILHNSFIADSPVTNTKTQALPASEVHSLTHAQATAARTHLHVTDSRVHLMASMCQNKKLRENAAIQHKDSEVSFRYNISVRVAAVIIYIDV